MAQEDNINAIITAEYMECLGEFDLNEAYLDDIFEVDLHGLLQERVRVGSGKDEVMYSLVRTKLLWHCNPYKVKEYSYRVQLVQKNNITVHISHGLFEDGVFISGQCFQQSVKKD